MGTVGRYALGPGLSHSIDVPSMAHKGGLFLDEMPEFDRKTLEVPRQPLEEGKVTISQAMNSSTFPADFILVAAMSP